LVGVLATSSSLTNRRRFRMFAALGCLLLCYAPLGLIQGDMDVRLAAALFEHRISLAVIDKLLESARAWGSGVGLALRLLRQLDVVLLQERVHPVLGQGCVVHHLVHLLLLPVVVQIHVTRRVRECLLQCLRRRLVKMGGSASQLRFLIMDLH